MCRNKITKNMAHKNSFAHQSKLQIYGNHKMDPIHNKRSHALDKKRTNKIITITTINILSQISIFYFVRFASAQRCADWIFMIIL